MKLPAGPLESSYTGVRILAVLPMNDSLDMPMSGPCLRRGGDEPENLPIASACYVVPPVPESDGSGTVKTMFGPKSTVSISGDGST